MVVRLGSHLLTYSVQWYIARYNATDREKHSTLARPAKSRYITMSDLSLAREALRPLLAEAAVERRRQTVHSTEKSPLLQEGREKVDDVPSPALGMSFGRTRQW